MLVPPASGSKRVWQSKWAQDVSRDQIEDCPGGSRAKRSRGIRPLLLGDGRALVIVGDVDINDFHLSAISSLQVRNDISEKIFPGFGGRKIILLLASQLRVLLIFLKRDIGIVQKTELWRDGVMGVTGFLKDAIVFSVANRFRRFAFWNIHDGTARDLGAGGSKDRRIGGSENQSSLGKIVKSL